MTTVVGIFVDFVNINAAVQVFLISVLRDQNRSYYHMHVHVYVYNHVPISQNQIKLGYISTAKYFSISSL